jgi:hypothetical protein
MFSRLFSSTKSASPEPQGADRSAIIAHEFLASIASEVEAAFSSTLLPGRWTRGVYVHLYSRRGLHQLMSISLVAPDGDVQNSITLASITSEKATVKTFAKLELDHINSFKGALDLERAPYEVLRNKLIELISARGIHVDL